MTRSHFPEHDRFIPRSTTITLDVVPNLLIGESATLPLAARLIYNVRDPFAVSLEFPGCEDLIKTWKFSRELLVNGLRQQSGDGNVRVWPPLPSQGRHGVVVRLGPTGDSALLEFQELPLRDWLIESLTLVPQGREADLINWTAEFAQVLD